MPNGIEPEGLEKIEAESTALAARTQLGIALVSFGLWLFIVYQIFSNIRELGGMAGLLEEIQNGAYADLVLLAISIFLLAIAMQSLFRFFRLKNGGNR